MHQPNSPGTLGSRASRGLAPLVLRSLALLAAAAGLTLGARAHDVLPLSLTLRPGGEDFIFVADAGTCPANIQATSTQPGLATVFAINMSNGTLLPGSGITAVVTNRVTQVFVVRAAPGITTTSATTIEICWVGSDFPGGPCNENNCSPYAPTIVNVTIEPDPSVAASNSFSGVLGDPLATHSGEFFSWEPADLELGGPLPLVFARTYSSRLELDGVSPGSLGPNWTHTFEWRLERTGNNVEITDPEGRLTRFEKGFLDANWSLALYEDEPFQLIEAGGAFSMLDPRDGLVYGFDVAGDLVSISDGRGNMHSLSYAAGRLDQVSDGLGRTLTFQYGGGGELDSVSDGTRFTMFTYDGSGRLETVTNADAKVTTFAYDPAHPAAAYLTSKQLPEGNIPYVQTYDANGRVVMQTDAFTNAWSLDYDTTPGTTSITDPDLNVSEHVHQNGRLEGYEDEQQRSAASSFDAQGRRTSVTDRKNGTTSWTYDGSGGGVRRRTESDGSQTNFTYVTRNQGGFAQRDVSTVTYPGGAQESYTYDAVGNVTSVTVPGGAVTTYTHNGFGQVTSITNPLGGFTALTYHADGNLESITDQFAHTTQFDYDGLGRLQTVTYEDGGQVQYTRDPMDRIISVVDREGGLTTYTYDDNGNFETYTGPDGELWTMCYDALDRMDCRVDPLGHTSGAMFDAAGRLSRVYDDNGFGLDYTYDELGQPVTITDQMGHAWTRTYDEEGLPASLTSPTGNTADYTYDRRGRLTSRTTPPPPGPDLPGSPASSGEEGVQTGYDWNSANRVTAVEDELGNRTTIQYDAGGCPRRVKMPPAGLEMNLRRNLLGQVLEYEGPGGAIWTSDYDLQGRLTWHADPLGRIRSYFYDDLNRVESADLAGMGTVDYRYDASGFWTNTDYSDGLSLRVSYNLRKQITAVGGFSALYAIDGFISAVNGILIGRDPAGRITSFTYGPGRTVNYVWDDAGRCTSMTDWLGDQVGFVYDDSDLLTRITRPNGLFTDIGYDANGRRLLVDHGALGRFDVTRNAKGQIVRVANSGSLLDLRPSLFCSDFTYDAAGQITNLLYFFDDLGRRIFDPGGSYVWNLAGNLLSYDQLGVQATLNYDDFGGLIQRTQGGMTRDYVLNYALPEAPVSIEREGAVDKLTYLHHPDGWLVKSISELGGSLYYHYDYDLNTVALSDQAGGVLAQYDYVPSGELVGSTGPAADQPYTWKGAVGVRWEVGTDMYRLQNRWYDAGTTSYLEPEAPTSISPLRANPYGATYLGNPTPTDTSSLGVGGGDAWSPTLNFGAQFAFDPGGGPLDRHTELDGLATGLGSTTQLQYEAFDPGLRFGMLSPNYSRVLAKFQKRGKAVFRERVALREARYFTTNPLAGLSVSSRLSSLTIGIDYKLGGDSTSYLRPHFEAFGASSHEGKGLAGLRLDGRLEVDLNPFTFNYFDEQIDQGSPPMGPGTVGLSWEPWIQGEYGTPEGGLLSGARGFQPASGPPGGWPTPKETTTSEPDFVNPRQYFVGARLRF